LRIPHRELTARRFVLVPLLELDPELAVPGAGSAADALAALGDGQAVRRAGPPLDVSS
jgi:2-amino-4-hydroxy-6-hydroxymethyldihydropteridine diphosphokinase